MQDLNNVPQQNMKKCPHCGEMIKAEAVLCRYCHRDLSQPAAPAPTYAPVYTPIQQEAKKPLPFIVILVIVGLGFLLAGAIQHLLSYFVLRPFPPVLRTLLSYAVMGVVIGLAVGLAQQQKIGLYILAGFAGALLSGVFDWLSRAALIRPVTYNFLMGFVLGILFGIAFCLVSNKWKQLVWFIIAGANGFLVSLTLSNFLMASDFLREFFEAMLLFSTIVKWLVIGLGFGLVFAVFAAFEKKQQQPAGLESL